MESDGIDALPHLDLRHDERDLARAIDADESIGREWTGSGAVPLVALTDAASASGE